ncbi:permease prefix domain 1-containing protein [Dyella sp.]|uniref:permease prefix domain 1-containing protein n=1 Tax=Dyella sp. TaxID=1869338 RepID=UPI002D794181|nr:permease prefix domain 1-containing protein [Dyella sp.]HET7329289.1 permease prefix domain 1-containing protein [Dyella sp.]
MSSMDHAQRLEEQIDQWRSYLRRRQAIHAVDIAELEDHLREQIAGLTDAGLAPDEAFLVAVKRMGELDALSREFACEHSDRLWKQLVAFAPESAEPATGGRTDAIVAFGLAVAAALAIKLPALFGLRLDQDVELLDQGAGVYARNMSLFVLPFLAGYFAWKRQLGAASVRWLAVAFVAAIAFVNIWPFAPGSDTLALAVLHLPIALWLLVGVAYAGGRWGQVDGRMDFIRFSGELFIYYVLIALGGGVLTGFMALLFQAIGINAEPFFAFWLLPCCAMGAVIVGAWLVEAKQSVIENMAPVLTRLFAPLFAAVLVAFLAALLWTGHGLDIGRNVLIAFDLLLAVVLGLLLYSLSARDPRAAPGTFDVVLVVLVVSALLADAVALWAIAARISEFGFSANRVAALGENAILLVNLAWSAVLYIRFARGRGSFAALERWQTDYLPVYAVWAAIVVVVFPLLFG